MKRFTADELRTLIKQHYTDMESHTVKTLNRWLTRGDGVAVYQNVALDSHNVGDVRLVSFGSSSAQLMTEKTEVPGEGWTLPPNRMPDIGPQVGWKYQLAGYYFGEAL